MVDAKVTIDLEGLKNLAEHAKRNGTEQTWMDIAIEYMEQLHAEVVKLRGMLSE